MLQSKFLSVGVKDFLHGFFIAVVGGVLTVIQQSCEQGSLKFDFKAIGSVAAISAIGYISKKFVSNSNGEVFKSETPQ